MDKKLQETFNDMANQLANLRLTYTDHQFVQRVLGMGLEKLKKVDNSKEKEEANTNDKKSSR